MSNVIPLRRGPTAAPPTPYEKLIYARSAMTSAFIAWSSGDCELESVADEADATCSIIKQLVEIERINRGR